MLILITNSYTSTDLIEEKLMLETKHNMSMQYDKKTLRWLERKAEKSLKMLEYNLNNLFKYHLL